jgi:gluconokinase
MIVIVMGVSGAGKTRIGSALAARLGWSFYDADDFHPRANVEKMSTGHALDDADRAPWLAALRELLERLVRERKNVILACSALQQSFRDSLTHGLPVVRFVHLDAAYALIEERLRERPDHFMPPELLPSQYDTLESPANALHIDSSRPVDEVVQRIIDGLQLDDDATR